MASHETYSIRENPFFRGELMLSTFDLQKRITELARSLLFLRSINCSINCFVPPRIAGDEAFPELNNNNQQTNIDNTNNNNNIELMFHEVDSQAIIDYKSIEEAMKELLGSSGGNLQQQSTTTTTTSNWRVKQMPLEKITKSAATNLCSSSGKNNDNNNNNTSIPEVPCIVRQLLLRVSTIHGSGGGGHKNTSTNSSTNTTTTATSKSSSFFSVAFGSFSSAPTPQLEEEWCIPIVVLQPNESNYLNRLISSLRMSVKISNPTFLPPTMMHTAAGGRENETGNNNNINNIQSKQSSAVESNNNNNNNPTNSSSLLPVVPSASAAYLGLPFSVGEDLDDDNWIDVSAEEMNGAGGDIAELTKGLLRIPSVTSVTATVGSPRSVSLSESQNVDDGNDDSLLLATSSASPNNNNNNSSSRSPPLASTSSSSTTTTTQHHHHHHQLSDVDSLCALLQPDNPARLNRILLWMQEATCDSFCTSGRATETFANAEKVIVSVALAPLPEGSGSLVESSRKKSVSPPSSFSTNPSSSTTTTTTTNVPQNNNAGIFKGFSTFWKS